MSATQVNNPSSPLAEPFSQIFVDRAEADWAFDLLLATVKRLGLKKPNDERFALTLPRRAGKLCLHLNFGQWLVLGFCGPSGSGEPPFTMPRVEMTLLADQVSWNERFTTLPSERKQGEPEVRSYHLPLESVRPLTSDLQAAYETTLDFIAGKFQAWKRSPFWKQHNPEIIEALFDLDKREQLFAGLFTESELRYERHFTAFHEIAEEDGIYEIESDSGINLYPEQDPQRRSPMSLDQDKIGEMIALVRSSYPNWSGFSDPDFMRDEIDYKRATIAKANKLLNETELRRLINQNSFEEFINRLDKIGKDNNLLWRSMPSSGDLNILYAPNLDKLLFCEAVFDLLYGPGESPERLERYLNFVETAQLPNKWTFPTYFLFICHPKTEIFVKPRTIKWFVEFFGNSNIYTAKPIAKAYDTIKKMALQLKTDLQDYEPVDMVDIQSLIWVCRPEKQSIDESKLAEPFSQIFVDRQEAEWAFDLLQETFELLGIKTPDDPRFALVLARRYGGLSLHFDFGNWLILGFREPNLRAKRIRIPFIATEVNFREIFVEQNFIQEDNEPDIFGYGLPIEQVKPITDEIQQAYEITLAHIAKRFEIQGRCPWRNRYHQTNIAEAVFDWEKRKSLFDNGLQIPQSLIEEENEEKEIPVISTSYPLSQLAADTGFDETELARWVRAIERKGQIVLYGPPGTGKTFLAEKLAQHLVGGGNGFTELVQFHPAYAYEDFMQGLRPQARPDGGLDYPLVPGRFLQFCRRAQTRPDRCVLIIDEINRANLARVFGELMYLLEYRNREIPLAGGGALQIPANVRLIGTMNTADRSIALVDHALRRRFAFIQLAPNFAVLRRYHQQRQTGFPVEKLITVLTQLNQQIDDAHYAVGIAFFLHENLAGEIEDIWRMEIEPYLEEYFFDQPDKVEDFRWTTIKKKVWD